MRQTCFPFAIGFFLLLQGCSTSKSNPRFPVPKDDDIFYVAQRIHASCFASDDPQFLLEFSSRNSGLNFQLEGVWQNDYADLNMQVLGSFGEQYAYFEVKNNQLKVYSQRENISKNPELQNITKFISTLGAKSLRTLLCGAYLFNPNSSQAQIEAYNEVPKLKDEQVFFTTNEFHFSDHTAQVESNLGLYEPNSEKDEFELRANSLFSFGFWSGQSPLHIQWTGTISPEEVKPQFLDFNGEKLQVHLRLIDYH